MEAIGVGLDVARQELQRDGLAELQVVGAVDLAHAAFAEQADHAIAVGEDLAWQKARTVTRDPRRCRRAGRRGRAGHRLGVRPRQRAPHAPQKRCVGALVAAHDGHRTSGMAAQ